MIIDNAQLQLVMLAFTLAFLVGIAFWIRRALASFRAKFQLARRNSTTAPLRPLPNTRPAEPVTLRPMGLDAQWTRLHDFSRSTLSRAEHVLDLQAAAAEKLQATEYALAALLKDIASLMPPAQPATTPKAFAA